MKENILGWNPSSSRWTKVRGHLAITPIRAPSVVSWTTGLFTPGISMCPGWLDRKWPVRVWTEFNKFTVIQYLKPQLEMIWGAREQLWTYELSLTNYNFRAWNYIIAVRLLGNGKEILKTLHYPLIITQRYKVLWLQQHKWKQRLFVAFFAISSAIHF